MNTNRIINKAICVFLSLSYFCNSQTIPEERKENNLKEIKSIHIQYVNFLLLTPVNVSCDLFASALSGEIKNMDLNDSNDIDKFKDIILKLNPVDTICDKIIIDTRAKIQIILPSDTISICMDQFYLDMLGTKYHTPKELIDLIDPSYNDGNE